MLHYQLVYNIKQINECAKQGYKFMDCLGENQYLMEKYEVMNSIVTIPINSVSSLPEEPIETNGLSTD